MPNVTGRLMSEMRTFSSHAEVFRELNASFMTCDKYFVILTKLDSAMLHSRIYFSRQHPAEDKMSLFIHGSNLNVAHIIIFPSCVAHNDPVLGRASLGQLHTLPHL